MSGRVSKGHVPIRHRHSLPHDVREAIAGFRNNLKSGAKLVDFANNRGNSSHEGPPLPKLAKGFAYYEHKVGNAHSGDKQNPAGSRRIVVEADKNNQIINEVYYSGEHYTKGTFQRITAPPKK